MWIIGSAEAKIIELETDKASHDNDDLKIILSGMMEDRSREIKSDVDIQILTLFFDSPLCSVIASEINSNNTFSVDYPITHLAKINELHLGETATYTIIVSDKFERTNKPNTFDFFNNVTSNQNNVCKIISEKPNLRFVDFFRVHDDEYLIQLILEKTKDGNCKSYNAKIPDVDYNFIFGWSTKIEK